MIKGVETNLAELFALRTDAAHLNFSARKVARSRKLNQSMSRFRARGMDYFESRPYTDGDDIRNIDWRVTARTGDLHSKIYTEERERPVVLLLDFSPSMYFGTRTALKSVVSARLAALLSWYAVDKGDRVGSLLFSRHGEHDIRPASGTRSVLALMNALQDATNSLHSTPSNQDNYLYGLLKHAGEVVRPGSLIFLISDFFEVDESLRQPLHRLSTHNDIISFFISDPLEQTLPDKALPLSNGKQRFIMRRRDKSGRAQIQNHYQHRLDWVEQELAKIGQPLIQLSTTDSLVESLSVVGLS